MSSPAEIYEEYMVPAYFAPVCERVVATARPQPGERVLDVACGTGIVARRIAPLVGPSGQVTGLDLSPAMLDVARRHAEQEGQTIDWREGRAEALPFPDESFDLVVCEHGLQFIPDKPSALADMRRVLRPGGRMVASVTQELEHDPFELQLNRQMEQRYGLAPLREIYSLGDADTLRALLQGAGLRDVGIERLGYMMRYPDPERFLTLRIEIMAAAVPSLRHQTPQDRRELVAGIRDAMAPQLAPYIMGDEVVIPEHVQIAHGRR